MDMCTNPDILTIVNIVVTIIDIIKTVIPIILIIIAIISFAKCVVINEEDAQKKNVNLLIKRFIYAALIFTIPWMVELVLIEVGNIFSAETTNFTDCLENVKNIDYYRELASSKQYIENNKESNDEKEEILNEKENISLIENKKNENPSEIPNEKPNDNLEEQPSEKPNDNLEEEPSEKPNDNLEEEPSEKPNDNLDEKPNENPTENENLDTGMVLGQKYILSEEQLRAIARLCQQEQGSAKGAAAEASLMANQFELDLYKKGTTKYGKGGTGLYNYVAYSGWFANSKKYMGITVDKNGNTVQTEESANKMIGELKNSVYTAVYEVLVLGKRTLPYYIDEHDCIKCGKKFDIIKIITDGSIITDENELLDRNNYVQDATIIYNRYNSEYTFYVFPTKSSDPFGYTNDAKKKYNKLMNK